jgi:hypothetical protein
MKTKFIISILVLIAALALAYFDGGAIGTTLTIAGGLPLVSLEFDGEDNLPGVARGYIIKTKDIETEAKPDPAATEGDSAITIVGSHVLATDKYFVKMYSTLGKGTLKFESEGSRDFENFKVSGMLFYPSTKKQALAMSTAILGQDLIIELEENSDSDYFLQIGTKKLPAGLFLPVIGEQN